MYVYEAVPWNIDTVDGFWSIYLEGSWGKSRLFTRGLLQRQLERLPLTLKPFPSGAPGLQVADSSKTSVQMAWAAMSKFPLEQCRSSITTFWRLAPRRFPNGPNLEGLFRPSPSPSQSPPRPPLNHPHCAKTHTYTHRCPLFQTEWIE